MKRICFFMFLVLFWTSAYSQTYKIEQRSKEEVEGLKTAQGTDCWDIISFDYPISFVICPPYTTVNSSWVIDTVVVMMEFAVRFHFADTADSIVIEDIHKSASDSIPLCPGKKLPKSYFKNIMTEFFNSCGFYYVLEKNAIGDFRAYYVVPIKLIPQLPCDNTGKKKIFNSQNFME